MKSNLSRFTLLVMLLLPVTLSAQKLYTVDLRNSEVPLISNGLKLGTHTAPDGSSLDANNQYFIKNGQPWFPVMGEIHFSRFPKAQWEESILKMKAAGIDVIASYIFWIYHEEEEGKFDWTGNRDLRTFAELCKKHGMKLFIRIGPWCHGEVRNGGFPDWLLKRGNTRKNDPAYLASVQKLYTQIGKQLTGLYFKDGGPVIGAQIENEFRFNSAAGLDHILTLKKMAVTAGIDVPYYTATGWPGSNQQQDELVPVWGAYPEAPWDKKTTKLALSVNYTFGAIRDPSIGSDILGKQDATLNFKGYKYPYATAEMGGGNQVTYHRRPIIQSDDVTALTYVKTGSGANLMGYYMFHGGSDPIGKNSTLQESKATNYANDYTLINYDFFAPIGEWGQLRPSYRGFKVIHTFLNEFGNRLVQEFPSFPDQKPSGLDDASTLRFAVRSKENSGFVFLSNFQRQLNMQAQKDVKFKFTLKDGNVLEFPETPLDIQPGLQAVFPFNMDLDGVNLNYATAQPLCRIEGKIPTYVFFAPEGIQAEYSIDGSSTTDISAMAGSLKIRNNTLKDGQLTASRNYVVKVTQPGPLCFTLLTLENKKQVRILTLTHQQALDSWKANVFGAERLVISRQELIFPEGKIRVQSTGDPNMELLIYPKPPALAFNNNANVKSAPEELFTRYTFSLPTKKMSAAFHEVTDIHPYAYAGAVPIPADDRNAKNIPSSIGPQYQTTLIEVPGARYWQIDVPAGATTATVTNAFLGIHYAGDTGSLYLDGKLIADDFYTGLPMDLGLKSFGKQLEGKKLLLQIVPLTDERQIFFEDGIREPLKGKVTAQLNSVTLQPQYEVMVTRK